MNVFAISLMGNSPPVATEFIDYVSRGNRLLGCILLSTFEPDVKESTLFAAHVLRHRFPHLSVRVLEVSIQDVVSEDDMILFMKTLALTIREARRDRKQRHIYLNLAGGRKSMTIAGFMLAQMLAVEGVFHVINRDAGFNPKLERIRGIISDLSSAGTSERREEVYIRHQKVIEEAMFPPHDEYCVLRFPTIPFPVDYLGEVMKILRSEHVPQANAGLSPQDLERLIACGLVERGGGSRLVVTPLGRSISRLL